MCLFKFFKLFFFLLSLVLLQLLLFNRCFRLEPHSVTAFEQLLSGGFVEESALDKQRIVLCF